MDELKLLVCGPMASAAGCEDETVSILRGLEGLIGSYWLFCGDFRKDIEAPVASYFLPVALRSLMEASAIAMLARIDPLRVVLSSKSQSAANYNKAQPQASALRWKGDVVGTEAGAPQNAATAAAKPLWDPNLSTGKLPRHLLSDHMSEAVWVPAAKNVLNTPGLPTSQWINEIQAIAPDDLPRKLIGDGNQIYSELSKGIHPEFAVRREAEYDGPTLQTYVERSLKWICSLALLTHFAASFSSRLQRAEAFQYFEATEAACK